MSKPAVAPCSRCGVVRRARPDRPGLCRDCRAVLSMEEREARAA